MAPRRVVLPRGPRTAQTGNRSHRPGTGRPAHLAGRGAPRHGEPCPGQGGDPLRPRRGRRQRLPSPDQRPGSAARLDRHPPGERQPPGQRRGAVAGLHRARRRILRRGVRRAQRGPPRADRTVGGGELPLPAGLGSAVSGPIGTPPGPERHRDRLDLGQLPGAQRERQPRFGDQPDGQPVRQVPGNRGPAPLVGALGRLVRPRHLLRGPVTPPAAAPRAGGAHRRCAGHARAGRIRRRAGPHAESATGVRGAQRRRSPGRQVRARRVRRPVEHHRGHPRWAGADAGGGSPARPGRRGGLRRPGAAHRAQDDRCGGAAGPGPRRLGLLLRPRQRSHRPAAAAAVPAPGRVERSSGHRRGPAVPRSRARCLRGAPLAGS